MDGLTLQEILNSMRDKKYNHRIKSKNDLRLLNKAHNQYLESFYNNMKECEPSVTIKKSEQR